MVTFAYTLPGLYQNLNRALCHQNTDRVTKMYSLCLAHAIYHAPRDNIPSVLWRGVHYSPQLLRLYAEHQGETIYLFNFISTSRVSEEAQKFPHRTPSQQRTLIRIEIPSEDLKNYMGDVSGISCCPREQEILLAPNMAYRIDSVDVGKRRITLTIVGVDKCLGDMPNKVCNSCAQLGLVP